MSVRKWTLPVGDLAENVQSAAGRGSMVRGSIAHVARLLKILAHAGHLVSGQWGSLIGRRSPTRVNWGDVAHCALSFVLKISLTAGTCVMLLIHITFAQVVVHRAVSA